MAYPGDPEVARSLGGGPTDDELPAGGIAAAMVYGKSQVFEFTNKDDWDTGDKAAGTIAKAVEYFASSYIRDNWKDKEKKAKEHYDRAEKLCKLVMKNPNNSSLVNPPVGETVSQTYVYKTPAKNPEQPFYKSPRTDV